VRFVFLENIFLHIQVAGRDDLLEGLRTLALPLRFRQLDKILPRLEDRVRGPAVRRQRFTSFLASAACGAGVQNIGEIFNTAEAMLDVEINCHESACRALSEPAFVGRTHAHAHPALPAPLDVFRYFFFKDLRSESLIAFPFQVAGVQDIVRVDGSFHSHEHCMSCQTVTLLEKGILDAVCPISPEAQPHLRLCTL